MGKPPVSRRLFGDQRVTGQRWDAVPGHPIPMLLAFFPVNCAVLIFRSRQEYFVIFTFFFYRNILFAIQLG